MGFQSNFTAGTAVTISGSVTTTANLLQPNSSQTIVTNYDTTSRSYTQSTAITQIDYTVPANKIYYITDYNSVAIDGYAGIRGNWRLMIDSTIVDAGMGCAAGNSDTIANGASSRVVRATPIVATAGQHVYMKFYNFSATQTVTYMAHIGGYLVST